MNDDVVTMFRPIGPRELELVAASGWRRWPPRLPGQPIFYPVTNREYAEQIAREWNVPESGAGFVTQFNVRRCSWSVSRLTRSVALRTRNGGSRPRTSKSSTTTSSEASR